MRIFRARTSGPPVQHHDSPTRLVGSSAAEHSVDIIGRFVAAPWEGLRWEVCASTLSPSLTEPDLRNTTASWWHYERHNSC